MQSIGLEVLELAKELAGAPTIPDKASHAHWAGVRGNQKGVKLPAKGGGEGRGKSTSGGPAEDERELRSTLQNCCSEQYLLANMQKKLYVLSSKLKDTQISSVLQFF